MPPRSRPIPGSTNLFHVLLGVVDRDSTNNGQGSTNLGCFEHAIQPYFTPQDLSDWQMVTITSTGTPIVSYNLPALRAATTLPSRLPRVSFFTTPSFLAVWNTNDSNQHRVTANQALLAALGEGFTNATASIPTPPSSVGLDGQHAVTRLGLLRLPQEPRSDAPVLAEPVRLQRPGAGQGDVDRRQLRLRRRHAERHQPGRLRQVPGPGHRHAGRGQPVNRFALATAQHLCFFANSAACEETDPEMRRVALAFQNASYDFKTLVRELFASPLVTAWSSTATFAADGVTISVARRDQLCAALSNRLGKPDLCEIVTPTPTGVTTATNRLAGSIPADAFSRGSQLPVTPPDPNLFYRAASELVCEAIAAKVVDGPAATNIYTSATGSAAAMTDMVGKVMGLPPSDPHYAGALKALQDHYNGAVAARSTTTASLRSTFAAACQSPTSLALGI